MRAQEFVTESNEYILYVNDKPAAKYVDQFDAKKDMAHLAKKYPGYKLEIKFEVCNLKTVQTNKPVQEVTIDNRNGAGSVPYNADVDYFGIRCAMKPSMFLKLAAPLGREHSPDLEKYIANGGAIGAPFLTIKIPEGWDDGDFSKPAQVLGHEGRNRMHAIQKLEGDEPIEVHIFPTYYRARDMNADFLKAIQSGLVAEKSGRFVPGPIMNGLL